MEKIVFEGTEQEMNNLKALIGGIDKIITPLPNMTVISERDVIIERLGHYVSDDAEESYDKLLKQSEIDGNVIADDVVLMWEPLEDRYTVTQLLDEIT
mgnify:CR=1 FL=1|tara:strand:- start:4340 stop:4633 length:294 start_codon:yes stop_codon:yes gene_type:complete